MRLHLGVVISDMVNQLSANIIHIIATMIIIVATLTMLTRIKVSRVVSGRAHLKTAHGQGTTEQALDSPLKPPETLTRETWW